MAIMGTGSKTLAVKERTWRVEIFAEAGDDPTIRVHRGVVHLDGAGRVVWRARHSRGHARAEPNCGNAVQRRRRDRDRRRACRPHRRCRRQPATGRHRGCRRGRAMKLTLGRAQSLMIALAAVDRDEKCRLDGRTRIAIAIDITLLQPHVAACEKVRAQKLREIMGEGVNPVKDAEFAAADADLRESEVEVALKQFALADLKLDDNPRITGAMIAMLAPALSDLPA